MLCRETRHAVRGRAFEQSNTACTRTAARLMCMLLQLTVVNTSAVTSDFRLLEDFGSLPFRDFLQAYRGRGDTFERHECFSRVSAKISRSFCTHDFPVEARTCALGFEEGVLPLPFACFICFGGAAHIICAKTAGRMHRGTQLAARCSERTTGWHSSLSRLSWCGRVLLRT